MTVSSSYSPVTYTGDGSQTEWPTPFRILAASDVRAGIVGDGGVSPLTYGTDYTVTVDADGQGGTVHYPCPAGAKLLLWLEVPERQELELSATGPLPPKELEKAFDRLTLLCQQLREQVGRAVKVDMSSDTPPDQLMDDLGAAVAQAQDAAGSAESSSAAAAVSAEGAAGAAQAAADSDEAATNAVATGLEAMETLRQATIAAVAGASVPVGAEFMWFADPADPTGDIPAGYVLGMGEELSRATFADLWAFAEGTGRVISEAAWQAAYAANNGNVGFYSPGNGSTTFRAPRIVRHVSGGEIAESGAYVADALKAHNHVSGLSFNNGAAGVVKFGITDTGVSSSQKDADGQETLTTTYGANTSTVGGAENLVRAIKRTCIIKAFSAAVNTGGVDVEQLATDVSALASRLEAVGTPVKTSVYKTSTYYQNLVANIIGDAGDVLPTEGVEVAAVSHTTRYANSKLIVQFSAFVQAVSVGVNGMLVDNGGLVNAERVAGTGTTQVQILRAVIDNGGPAGTVHSISARLGRDSVAGSFNVGNFATATFGLNQHQIVLTVEEVHA
ncbi:hypothetical protein DA2_3802 [Desulfovibrio sp. A2]|nr:hypothetical protein DA2_3802 [Desulfovibrio sp. A2]